jgi:NADH-quinone oxidoreductase subunit J
VLGAVYSYCIFNHIAETQSTVPYILSFVFHNSGSLSLLNSQFLAIVHIIVYSGAIMILFLFTIMLMNLNKENEFTNPELQDWERSFPFA